MVFSVTDLLERGRENLEWSGIEASTVIEELLSYLMSTTNSGLYILAEFWSAQIIVKDL